MGKNKIERNCTWSDSVRPAGCPNGMSIKWGELIRHIRHRGSIWLKQTWLTPRAQTAIMAGILITPYFDRKDSEEWIV